MHRHTTNKTAKRPITIFLSSSLYDYRKNWNIILAISTKNRGPVAGVRIIHAN